MLGSLTLLASLLGILGAARGQTFQVGPCPDTPVQEAFDITKVGDPLLSMLEVCPVGAEGAKEWTMGHTLQGHITESMGCGGV